jgi:hypothetical protein
MLLPELLKIGDVCRPEHSSKMRPLDADNRLNPNEREIGTVVWNSKDYQRVVDRFTWKPTGPSLTTSDVLLAQEDLYVYQTLLKVVKTTNEGAASKDNAAIKRIDRLAVGRDATNAWQEAKVNIAESNRPESAGGPLKPSDLQSEEARRAAMKAARKAQRSGETEQAHLDIGEIVTQSEMMADATDGSSLIINRYVKDNGSPVGVAAPETGTNRASGRGNPAAAATPTITHPFKEFRMLPIHMKLVVDERKLPVLLAACANANLPICIRQIDMVKPERKSGMQELVGGAGGSAWDQMNPTQRARALRESKMAAEELAEARKDKEAESRAQRTKESLEQFDMTVNIFGLVLIYNPPDSTQFAEAAKAIKEEESKATESGEAPTSTFDDSPTPPAARKDAADAGSAKASRAEKSDARADRGEIDAVGRRCVALGKSTLSRRGAPS